jgi:uncharacterized protein
MAAVPDTDTVVFYTPDDAGREMAVLAPSIRCVPQGGGDLGRRMASALDHLITECGSRAAILVGADIPLLSADHFSAARAILEKNGGVVLGPADDGGYYLIGMTELHLGLFDRIPWGTETVLIDTLRAGERMGIEARLIGSAYDLDTIEDLRRLEGDLASAPGSVAPNLREWFADKLLQPDPSVRLRSNLTVVRDEFLHDRHK